MFGIEIGLDTNARKNRGGHIMERCVARIFDGRKLPTVREVRLIME